MRRQMIFGGSVAISGETVVVGALFDDGAAGAIKARPMSLCAAVASGASSRSWRPRTRRISTFGLSVAISGETIVVGAVEMALRAYQGSAYVFVRSGGVWSEQQRLKPSDAANSSWSASRWRSAWRPSWSARRAFRGERAAAPESDAEEGAVRPQCY